MREIFIIIAIVVVLGILAYFSIPLFAKLFQLSKRGQQIISSEKVVYEIPSENKSIKLSDFTDHLDEKGSAYFR